MAFAWTSSMQTGKHEHEDEPPVELISGVLNDARDLAVAEVDKLKAEAITQVKGVGEEVKVVGAGALALTVAAMMLGMALSFGLAALGLPLWAGFLITGVMVAAGGLAVLRLRGSRKSDG